MATVKNLLSAMIDKINATPKTVNGIAPDVNGNIEVAGGSDSSFVPTIFTYNSYWDYEVNEDGEFKKELSCNKTFNQVVEDFKNGNPLTYVYVIHDENYYFDGNSYITPHDIVFEIYEGEDGKISEESIIRVWLHNRPMPSVERYGCIEYFADGHFAEFHMGTGE